MDASTPGHDLRRRATARLIILNPRNEVLLIRYRAARSIDAERPNLDSFWYTPGGGIEPGETDHEAAARELKEETGIDGVPIGALVATWEGPITLFRMKTYTIARFFVVRAPNDTLDTSELAATEGDPVLDVRWFSLDQLSVLPEPVVPDGISELVASILAGKARKPVRLSSAVAASDLQR